MSTRVTKPMKMANERPPVLYLDLDDTVVSWADGSPRAGAGARNLLLWALSVFEVRWLTTWCPDGRMPEERIADLSRIFDIPPDQFRRIRGFAWDDTGSKLNGIAWLEHLVLARPFIWFEDENGVGQRERECLAWLGMERSYLHSNVSRDPDSLARARDALEAWLGGSGREIAS